MASRALSLCGEGIGVGAKGKATDEKAVTSRSLWFGLVTNQDDRQAEARGQ